MTPEAPAPTSRHRPEAIAVGLLGARLLLSIFGNAVRWDWLFDTAYLIAGLSLLALARSGPTAEPRAGLSRPLDLPIVLLLYLVLDALLRTMVAAFFPGLDLLVWPILAFLYGRLLSVRLLDRGVVLSRLPWSEATRGPDPFVTIASLVALACLYLPMLRIHRPLMMSTSPILLTVRNAIAYSPGRMVDFGGTYTYRGVEIAFSRAAALLLAGVAVVRLLQLAELLPPRFSLTLMRAFVIVTCFWWLLVAQGFRSLDHLFNLVFVACCGSLLVLLFRRAAA